MNNYKSIGAWSSILALLFGFGYSIPQILSSAKLIPHPEDLFWLFLPSLFLAPAFLVAMICLDFSAAKEQRIWTTIGWAFAAVYCVDVSFVYFTELTVVVPQQVNRKIDPANVLIFDRR